MVNSSSLISHGRTLAWIITLTSLCWGCASTSGIRGRLILPEARHSAESSPNISAKQRAQLPSGAQDAVISVIHQDQRQPKPQHRRCQITHTTAGFQPHVLAVPVGTEVEFVNRDRVYHKPFSISPTKRFDLGAQVPGSSSSVVFDRVGIAHLYCELHPATAGFVVVLNNELFAQPNARGEFALPELAEGNYVIKVWHPAYGEVTRRVSVPLGGGLDLELSY